MGGTGSDELGLLRGAGLRSGMSVVEFGCGVGALARQIARAVGPGGRVLGVDGSAFNVARARELALQEKLDNASFEVADPVSGKLIPECADMCVSREFLGRVSDPGAAVREMVRVARPGGIVVALEPDEGLVVYEPEPPALAELRDLLARRRLALGGNWMIGRSLYRFFAQAGLVSVRVAVLTSNSTDPEWANARDPSNHGDLLRKAVDDLVASGGCTPEKAGVYYRALDEVGRNPLAFVLVSRFFAYGTRPLRCA